MEREFLRKSIGFAYIPEALLLTGGIFCLLGDLIYGSSTPWISGLILSGISAVLALLIWKNKYLALSISAILGCISVLFLLALLSEFSEFPVKSQGLSMLLMGSLLFGGLLIVSVRLPKKYFNMR